MKLTLVLPSLVWPQALEEPGAQFVAPALARLLADTRLGAVYALTPEEWLAQQLGLIRQQDLPIAALLAQADGLNTTPRYWLFAEPVHLQLGHDDVRFGQLLHPIPEEETRAVLASLNAHFGADGWQFHRGASGRWYLALPSPAALRTVPPRRAWGQPVRHHLPQGDAARAWSRALTEVQMLLHAHPVNATREARGTAVINSLWFWGGGAVQALAGAQGVSLFAANELVCQLAAACGAKFTALPREAAMLDSVVTDAIVWLDALDPPHNAGEAAAWREALQVIESQWLAPLAERVNRGECALHVLACARDRAVLVEYQRPQWLARLRAPRKGVHAILQGLADRLENAGNRAEAP